MRVEHGRDNAGRRLSGNSGHDIVDEPEHTHTHIHVIYVRAGSGFAASTTHLANVKTVRESGFPLTGILHCAFFYPGSFYFAIF